METWQEILEIEKQMDTALQTLRTNGNAYAEAEKEYRIAKANKILKLKSEGYPITIIPDIAKGDMEVAELDLKRNIAETLYKCNLEALRVKQSEYSMHKVYYDKEYSKGE